MTFVLFKGRMHMKKSLYIYNCGDLKRKDNTLRLQLMTMKKETFQLKEFRIFM